MSSECPRALRRLVAPPRAAELANTGIQQRDLSPATKSQDLGVLNALSGRQPPGCDSLFDDRLKGQKEGREVRGDLLDICTPPKVHKIITHDVTSDPGAIRSVYDRFGGL